MRRSVPDLKFFEPPLVEGPGQESLAVSNGNFQKRLVPAHVSHDRSHERNPSEQQESLQQQHPIAITPMTESPSS